MGARHFVYLGDLSRADADLIADAASRAASVLEFGVGASTQILAQCCPPGARIVALDTEAGWIDVTRRTLAEIGAPREVTFDPYANLKAHLAHGYDLVLDDGLRKRRLEFALAAWPRLAPGGTFLLHDTRRAKDLATAIELFRRFAPEIATVAVNPGASNMTILRKQAPKEWADWNEAEGRPSWMQSAAAPGRPADWLEILRRSLGSRQE